jgi:two-component system cell cycle response regulator
MSIKILTVDDSKTIRMIVTKAFKSFDCTVIEAANGVVGLATASREKPDIILLDYTMPVMDGFEVLGRLRADPDLKATPVIMLTAEAGRETVIKIAKLGVRDYLIKPFKEDLLIQRVGRVVSLIPKAEATKATRRFDDPIQLLVVDDKPAILEQIRTGLGDTPWKIESAEQPAQAIERCAQPGIDLILVSLSLPNEGAFKLIQTLKDTVTTSAIPVFGLCVKTAAAEQARAQQSGFAGVINKPIDPDELKSKISRALHLEISQKYFQSHGRTLVIWLPKDIQPGLMQDISSRLKDKITGTVDAGGDRVVIDLREIENASLPIIEFVLAAMQAAGELSLQCIIAATDKLKIECRGFEEAQAWVFAPDVDSAMAVAK